MPAPFNLSAFIQDAFATACALKPKPKQINFDLYVATDMSVVSGASSYNDVPVTAEPADDSIPGMRIVFTMPLG